LNCQYCRAANDPDDHRCRRCGRRLGDTAYRPETVPPVQHTATAPRLDDGHAPADPTLPPGPQLVTELPKAAPQSDYAFQASLFGPVEVARPDKPAANRPATPLAPQRARKHGLARQQKLDFSVTAEGARSLDSSIEASLFCKAPVAIPAHRTVAAAFDFAIIASAAGVFLLTSYFAGHTFVLTKFTLPFYAAVVLFISLFYRLMFCLGDADTLGVHWAGLRVLNFDGRRPTRRQRLNRTFGALVSVLAIGIGFVWALFDEEHLTWHDYMSDTFPSPRYH
jgi:uncharacterized RDD family membrane protein YckC